MTSSLGGLIGSIVVSVMELIFTKDFMLSYGWRIPFLSSAIISLIAYFAQRNMKELYKLRARIY